MCGPIFASLVPSLFITCGKKSGETCIQFWFYNQDLAWPITLQNTWALTRIVVMCERHIMSRTYIGNQD